MRAPLVAVITVSVALAACGQSKTSGATFLSINTATITKGSFKPSIKAISPLESTTNVTLSPQTDGQAILVVANGSGANAQQSLGTVIFGGLIVATVLSVGVVPPVYVLVKDLESRLLSSSK